MTIEKGTVGKAYVIRTIKNVTVDESSGIMTIVNVNSDTRYTLYGQSKM